MVMEERATRVPTKRARVKIMESRGNSSVGGGGRGEEEGGGGGGEEGMENVDRFIVDSFSLCSLLWLRYKELRL